DDRRERRQAQRLRAVLRHHDERRGAVVHPWRVPGRYRSTILECWFQLAERSGGGIRPNRLIAIDDHRGALALWNRDGHDLRFEQSGVGRLRRLLMAAGGVLVLRVAPDVVMLGDDF